MKALLVPLCAALMLPMTARAQSVGFTGGAIALSYVTTPEDDDNDSYAEFSAQFAGSAGPIVFQFDAQTGIYDGDYSIQTVLGHIGGSPAPGLVAGAFYGIEYGEGGDRVFSDIGLEAAYQFDRFSLDTFATYRRMLDTPLHGFEIGLNAEYQLGDRFSVFGQYFRDELLQYGDIYGSASLGARYKLTDALDIALIATEFFHEDGIDDNETQIGLILRYNVGKGAYFGPRTWQSYYRD